MKIGPGVSELWRIENRPLPLTWPTAYTTACHSNDGCLATGPLNLQFMMYKTKTKTSINFQIGVYIQQEIWVT